MIRRALPEIEAARRSAEATVLADVRAVERIERLRAECGCRVGEVTTAVAVVGVAATWCAGAWFGSPAKLAVGVAVSLIVVFAAGVTGKLAGMAIARMQARILARQIAHTSG